MDKKNAYSLEELATLTNSELLGNSEHIITGVDELESALSRDASFLSNPKYKELLKTTRAGVICIDRKTALVPEKNYLISDNPSALFQKIVHIFLNEQDTSGFKGIHPTAVIHHSVKLAPDVVIGPFVVIDQGSVVGSKTKICPHTSIGPNVSIGNDCLIHPNVTIREGCKLGNRVILQPGAVIGGCGYGYITDQNGKHIKIKHFGIVVLEDDVEIGSNTTIDRARFKETCIKRGTKIDNLVMIAHNVTIGEDNLIVAQVGVSGSSKTGKRVVLAGQSALVGHIEICDDVILLARGAFSKSIKEKGAYGGVPAYPAIEYHKAEAHIRRLVNYVDRIKTLEKKLQNKQDQEKNFDTLQHEESMMN